MATQTLERSPGQSIPFRERLKNNGGLFPYLLIFPTMLVILILAVYPMLDSLWLSVLDNPLVPQPNFVGLENYIQVLSDSTFLSATGTTLIFTVVSVLFETIFGLGIALLINKTFPGRGLVRAAILVPWAFPTVVSAQMWLLMYNDQTGIVTYMLQATHILAPGTTLIGSTSGVVIASLITDIWKTTPFMSLLILAGLQVIPDELYEAANVDGSTRIQSFFRITLPMLRDPLLIALLFRTLDAVRVFDLFYVFGARATPSMASYANLKMFSGTTLDFAPGVAAAVVVFLFGILISLVFVSMMRNTLRQA